MGVIGVYSFDNLTITEKAKPYLEQLTSEESLFVCEQLQNAEEEVDPEKTPTFFLATDDLAIIVTKNEKYECGISFLMMEREEGFDVYATALSEVVENPKGKKDTINRLKRELRKHFQNTEKEE